MITAYLDIQTRARCDPPAAPRPIAPPKRRPAAPAAAPKPSEASTTSMHALFEPLPPEEEGPRAAEAPGRELWQGPVPGQEEPEAGGGDWESAFMDEEERAALMEDGDDVSEPDFEADSLEAEEDDPRGAAAGAEELSSSVETVLSLKAVFGSRRAGSKAGGGRAVYSGPLLCCEDDDFDD